jgi:hypothetical protein
MTCISWKLLAGAVVLLAGITPAAAEDAPGAAEFAHLPAAAGIHEPDQGSTGPTRPTAPDIRALWADPAIRDFRDLSENAYDFNDPNSSIPGFGPLSPHDSQRLLAR